MTNIEPAKLYYIDGSPFARLCRILVEEWGLPVQLIEVPFPLPDDFFEINPVGQVPVLKTIGETIFPTSQIVEQLWAMTEEASEPFLEPLADRQLLSVILQIGDFLVAATQLTRAGFEQDPGNQFGFNIIERHHTRIQSGLDWIESRAQKWLTGNERNVCDDALACILLWSDSRLPIEWRNRTSIKRIVEDLQERPSFLATTPGEWAGVK